MEQFNKNNSGTGRNVIIFGVDMSSSTQIVNRKKNILILGKGPIQGLEHKLSAENCIQLILQCIIKSYVLMEQIVIYLLNVNNTEIHKFKVKDSEIVVIFKKYFKRLVSR